MSVPSQFVPAVLALATLMGASYAEAAKPRPRPTPTATPSGPPPVPTCAAAWNPSTAYGTTGSKPRIASRACGPNSTSVANYLADFGSTGKDPCVWHGLANSANPWGLPTGCGTIPTPAGPGMVNVLSEDQFETLLPPSSAIGPRQPGYQYPSFLTAANSNIARDKFGVYTFCGNGDSAKDLRECAAFLATVDHETILGTETDEHNTPDCPSYCDFSQTGACAPFPGKSYYGRGPIQLSWNFNYCPFSMALYGDNGSTLIQDPDRLSSQPLVGIQAAVWYWMTQEGPNNGTNWDGISAHDCMANDLGFGCVIRAVNGALECPALGGGGGTAEVFRQKRINYYRSALSLLGGQSVGPDDCIN